VITALWPRRSGFPGAARCSRFGCKGRKWSTANSGERGCSWFGTQGDGRTESPAPATRQRELVLGWQSGATTGIRDHTRADLAAREGRVARAADRGSHPSAPGVETRAPNGSPRRFRGALGPEPRLAKYGPPAAFRTLATFIRAGVREWGKVDARQTRFFARPRGAGGTKANPVKADGPRRHTTVGARALVP